MSGVKNILFDLDDTIYDFGAAEEYALTQLFYEIGVEPTRERKRRYSDINQAYWKRLEMGEITREQVKLGRFEAFFREEGIEYPAEGADGIYRKYLSRGHFFIPGAEEMLQALRENYRLFLVTNGTADVQKGRIASGQLEKYFEKIFISEEIGYNKPNKEFFAYCFSQMGNFKKSETILVGDSLTSDIQGGINAGIATVWFHRRYESDPGNIRPDHEIHELSELYGLLQKLNA